VFPWAQLVSQCADPDEFGGWETRRVRPRTIGLTRARPGDRSHCVDKSAQITSMETGDADGATWDVFNTPKELKRPNNRANPFSATGSMDCTLRSLARAGPQHTQ